MCGGWAVGEWAAKIRLNVISRGRPRVGSGRMGCGGVRWCEAGARKTIGPQECTKKRRGETRLEFGSPLRRCSSYFAHIRTAFRRRIATHADPAKSRETGNEALKKDSRHGK